MPELVSRPLLLCLGGPTNRATVAKLATAMKLRSIADQLAAAAGEDRRTACETCPLLLAAIGGEPSDETVVWQYAQAARRAAASGGIAGAAVAGKSLHSKRGRRGV